MYKPGAPKPGMVPGKPPGKPGLPPPPPPGAVVAKPKPVPKPITRAKPKKPKRKLKFFDNMKKKISVIILVMGLIIAAVGFFYPNLYWKSKNAYSAEQLDADQQQTPTLILYSSWSDGNEIRVHATVNDIEEMRQSVFINQVTYIEKLGLDKVARDIGDNHLVSIGNGQFFIVPGLEDPPINEGDTILLTGQIRTIIGMDSQGNEVRRAIMFVNPADIEENNMDSVFLGLGITGVIILFIGLAVWMYFVLVPEEKDPEYVDIHSEKRKEFMDQVGKQKSKEYPCPVCGINMTYKEEFGKWYCEICNKLM
jgi:hypothetical protein